MFHDIGLSLKKAGGYTHILSIVLGVISLIGCLISLTKVFDSFFIALLIGVAAFGFIWFPGYILSLVLYGHGETVHLLKDIRGDSAVAVSSSQVEIKPTQPSAIEKLMSTQPASKYANASDWICPSCKKKNTAKATYCVGCYQVRPKS